MMRHEVTFSGHRKTQGYIDFFGYKSDGIESQILNSQGRRKAGIGLPAYLPAAIRFIFSKKHPGPS